MPYIKVISVTILKRPETNNSLSSKEIPAFYGNLIFITVYTTARHLFLP
jgi:hypothetical protein